MQKSLPEQQGTEKAALGHCQQCFIAKQLWNSFYEWTHGPGILDHKPITNQTNPRPKTPWKKEQQLPSFSQQAYSGELLYKALLFRQQ